MNKPEEYKQNMAAQPKEWGARINLPAARKENTDAAVRALHAEELQALHAKQHAASEQLKALEKASGAARVQTKATAEKIWKDL